MIGVIPRAGQAAVVAEFFELFKTPWEFYEQGRVYDAVLATADEIPEIDSRLLLLYGSETKSTDLRSGVSVRSRHSGGCLKSQEIACPIYGELVTFEAENCGAPCVLTAAGITGVRIARDSGPVVLRLGYDLFQEIRILLSTGQPIEHAHIPTLDIHIGMLRSWILNEGIPLLEIPAAPAGHSFAVCLTHDIDFIGIRNHKFDHTMWGFLYRSTAGGVRNLLRGRISIGRFLKLWRAVASLPFVYLGWVKDFWEPFEWYLRVERGLRATYFLIPFKRRAGERVPGRYVSRRATAYDVDDLPNWMETLRKAGCELGVHGIDAWHSVEKGRAELARITAVTGESAAGVRTHWLLQDANTPSTLEQSGFTYDSTSGYNETVGYRSGTTQVFRPLGAKELLELPLHIQDGALFYPNRLDLPEPDAERRCRELIDNATKFGGVLTILWHDRSHGPERFWGDFYIRLVQALKSSNGWFATAGQAVSWFRRRREARFERIGSGNGVRISLSHKREVAPPELGLRVYRFSTGAREAASSFIDIPWTGRTVEFDSSLNPVELSTAELYSCL